MRFFLILGFILVLAAAACQGPPPTQYVLVVTATPEPAEATANSAPSPTPTSSATNTPAPTPTVDPFPTPTFSQIQVAEQVFERGRMFWIQPRKQIWVLQQTEPGRGKWLVYDDTFQEGEPEFDPTIIPPNGLYQPERGFGKLWRNTPELREALGFGVTPEFGYVSNYEYHAGGEVRDGQYVPGPGYHILFSLYQEKFRLNEVDSTWQQQ